MTTLASVLGVTTVAGVATGIGALPVFFRHRVTHRIYDGALGLAAGLMVAASVFGLVIPGMEEGTLRAVMAGVLLGGATLLGGNYLIPHLHAEYRAWFVEGGATADDAAVMEPPTGDSVAEGAATRGSAAEGGDAEPESVDEDAGTLAERESSLRKALLIGGAITLHNAPEGLAIGVAFASGLEEVALLLAVVIGLQNVPDGFAFAVPMAETGMSNLRVVWYTTLSGVVPQVVAAVFGFSLVSVGAGLFPVSSGFAAGAMLAVVFRELIPSSHGHGHADAATGAFLVGFVLLVVVDAVVVV
ncbi:ZIP family metal transporter [Halorubrum ezzemoulense]|jgi:ZIP family zinc transporter|uniref:ZIP family metal transporter n=1 Tax=Halorubrum ezzemoulense TaxID=337243 RepID=A0A256KR51_HALEZ|nr:ZIP family metal transporter [Halorubrum ezzemoulense]MDB2237009.1 ZIP family metal transporter [Halorubrum ezzemoulense]MDB2247002.1 ZIP family metal transporter [Halorubrum ezzemoulense]MDB2250539.1 ZIP family metal transporter [Halorubrum ezzemoulense]MDB2260149.1 ZIP family metal transporter [Halorubrum ezzemoulense]MDB2266617.1 ZIP family metal transporter [Halorubrum ezzemoulense]